jgi:hypothetical protein
MKRIFSVLTITIASFSLLLLATSCIISNTKPEDCETLTTKVVKITEGPSFDIVLHNEEGERYYINRGLEQGLNLDSLNTEVLNKTVTLHLANIIGGSVTSSHISQLAINDKIIFTEFD